MGTEVCFFTRQAWAHKCLIDQIPGISWKVQEACISAVPGQHLAAATFQLWATGVMQEDCFSASPSDIADVAINALRVIFLKQERTLLPSISRQ